MLMALQKAFHQTPAVWEKNQKEIAVNIKTAKAIKSLNWITAYLWMLTKAIINGLLNNTCSGIARLFRHSLKQKNARRAGVFLKLSIDNYHAS